MPAKKGMSKGRTTSTTKAGTKRSATATARAFGQQGAAMRASGAERALDAAKRNPNSTRRPTH
jgi:hypothetical protein